ncbi:uncharacterized protein LOC120154643 [Hibiscus syriacus]|uniref:uncharacterized protein LOC120154643 n=1 Tax=Hibiscus syriacus TaxID=106335 RepID=UPI001922A26E|nr:uncharacterized protein LOC120154643 [Hibiscus syriacus]
MKKIHFKSPPMRSSASPNDENDRPNLQRDLNLQKPMKQNVKTSSFPRKKVLGERNESPGSNSSITHFSKSPNLDSNPSPKIISKNSPNLDPKVVSKEPVSHKTPLSNSSRDGTPSPSPYDPLKNYLSPRPQFLRYNPERRKEIFLRLEMEDKEGDDPTVESDEADAVSGDSSLASSSKEDEEFGAESESLSENEDEEFEEGEDEAAWSLGGVLKYFLLSVVLLLSTSHISSMNSPVSAPAFEVHALGFQNHSFGIAEGFGYKFLDGKKEQLGLLSITQTMEDEVIEEEKANLGHVVSLEIDNTVVESEEMVEEASEEFEENIELLEMEETEIKGHVVSLEIENTVVESEEMVEEASEEFAENIELLEMEETEIKSVEKIEDESEKFELQEMGETEEQIEETQDVDEDIESLQVDHQASLFSEGTESSEEIREVPKEEDEDLHKETSDTDMVQVIILQISMLQKWGKSIVLNMRKGIAPKPSSSPVDKHSIKPIVKEKKASLPLPADDPIKLAVSNTMPLISTTSAVRSRAPSVELLTEFDFGEISRSVRSSAINRRMKDQVSSYSYFSEKDLGSKDQQGHTHLSAVNSNSSERSTSTAKKKRLGKELGSNNEVITPVRRSARIQNRADIVSP